MFPHFYQAILNFKSRALGGLGQPRSRTRLRAATAQVRRSLAAAKGVILLPVLVLRRWIGEIQAAPVEENA